MRTIPIRAFAAGLLAAAFADGASAAVQVLGAGPEVACYEAAKTGKPSRVGLGDCSLALATSDLSPRDRAATHVNRSVLQLAARRARDALADSDAALELQPDMVPAAVNRGAALIMLDRPAEARAALDAALRTADGRDLLAGLFNRAIAREAMGDVGGAYADLSRIAEIDPDFADVRTELARFKPAGP